MEQKPPYFLREYSKQEYSICCQLPNGTISNVCGHANKETAEFIVRACNSHRAMLDALKAVLKDHRRPDKYDYSQFQPIGTLTNDVEDIVINAILKAEKI